MFLSLKGKKKKLKWNTYNILFKPSVAGFHIWNFTNKIILQKKIQTRKKLKYFLKVNY